MSDNKIKVEGIFSKGFGILSKMVMQDRELHYISKVIYSYFCSFAGNGETCFPTRSKICYDLQLSTDTFSKYLKQLVEVGYIEVEQIKENGRFSHNIYTMLTTKSPCPKRTDTEDTVYGQTDTNNNSIKNNNNINNKELDISNDISNEKNFKNDNEVEEIEEEKPKKANKRNTFIPPTLDEVTKYCKERGNNIDPEEFIAHYTCRDWYIGKTNRKIKDWKSAVVVWEKNELRYKPNYKPQYGKQNEPNSSKKFFTADMKPEDYM